MRIPAVVRRLRHRAQEAQMRIRHRLRLYDSPDRLARAAQAYWTGRIGDAVAGEQFHLRGAGPFARDEVWWELGRLHLSLFDDFARWVGFPRPATRIVEWGCGGGANAVQFAREAREFLGVDVSQEALDQCEAELRRVGMDNFIPVLIDVRNHEAAVAPWASTCDLFLCTYVFELLPTPEHGAEILATALALLRPGGMALVQVKYATAQLRTRGRPWSYARHPAAATTYGIDEFWTLAEDIGFRPTAVVLRPQAPEVHDERYAYYLLMKPLAARP